ncbi:MAG TPA: tetratricopeptide repeat protein, partial [Promineifilum sp.]
VGGAPLGIVLAASWSGVLSVEEIAGEMRRDLDFAAVEMADVPERQRSLRAAFNHSWRLLDESERAIFSRLSVFRGGFTREAAAAVAGATLHDLLALANKSLLTRASRGRFDLHDLLRHFAETRLQEPDQVEATRLAHARYFLDLAKDAETRYTGAEQALALNSLEAERHNLNVALQWALDRGNWEAAAELAASLAEFWIIRGYLADGRSWYDKVLAHREKISPTTLATVLFAAGRLAFEGEDYRAAKTLFADSLALWRETDQHRRIAALLIELGRAVEKEGDYGSAIACYEESLARFRKLDDRSGAAKVLHRLGFVAQLMGDYATATTRTEDALALRRELDERRGMASSLNALAEIARTQGDYERARRLYEESLSLCRELGDKRCVAGVSHNMGHIATYQGHYKFAAASFERGFRLYQELDSRLGIVLCLAGMAGVWTARGRAERAARLLGATAKQIDDRRVLLDPADKLAWQQNLERTQAQLDHETFQEAWSIGRTLSLDEALREAMIDGDWRLPGRTAPPRPG